MNKADDPMTIVVGRHLTVGLTPNVEMLRQKFVISTTRFTQNKSISNATITLYVQDSNKYAFVIFSEKSCKNSRGSI